MGCYLQRHLPRLVSGESIPQIVMYHLEGSEVLGGSVDLLLLRYDHQSTDLRAVHIVVQIIQDLLLQLQLIALRTHIGDLSLALVL